MTDPKLLERIRKLLALGASPNPNEAASAIAHAQRLMQEHGLSEQDLDVAEIEDHGAAGVGTSRKRAAPDYEIMLMNAVKIAFGVEAYIDPEQAARCRFVGPGPRAQVAVYCFVVLLRQLREARRDYMLVRFVQDLRRLEAQGDRFAEAWVTAVLAVIRKMFLTEREAMAVSLWMKQRGLTFRPYDGRNAGFTRSADDAAGPAMRPAAGYSCIARWAARRGRSASDDERDP